MISRRLNEDYDLFVVSVKLVVEKTATLYDNENENCLRLANFV